MGAGVKTEFAAVLRSLVGGHGGTLSTTALFFDYGTSFPLFQIILRDITQLSTIPPTILEQGSSCQNETRPEIGSDMSSQISSIHHDQGIQKRVHDQGSDSSDPRLSPAYSPTLDTKDCPNLPRKVKPRCPSARGYTIDDGPWLYRIEIKAEARSSPFTEITEESSYLKMLDGIKEISRKDTKNEYQVILFHVGYSYTKYGQILQRFANLPVYGQSCL
jgi:hypothetical protein